MTEDNIQSIIETSIKDAAKGVGKLNILIAGKTGTGKSTLINSVFRGELAKTGTGRPVTQKIQEISKPGHPLTIIDTKGLEVKDYEKIKLDLENEIITRGQNEDPNKHIHLAWICIQSTSDRIEDAEIDLCKFLTTQGISTIVIATKSRKNDPFVEQVRAHVPSAKFVLGVRALREYDVELEGHREPIGLDDLIDATSKLLPDSHARAFSNALSTKNKRALKEKKERAEIEVNIAAGLAAAAGATPIPVADAVVLVPIQIAMLAKIGSTYGMELSTTAITTLISGALGSSALTLIGRTVAASLIKLIPGAGSAVGGVISGTTASLLTKALGNAYIAALNEFCEANPGKEIDIANIAKDMRSRINL